MQNPLPVPEGMTKECFESMPVSRGEWRKSEDFACCQCGDPAYLHPHTNKIWGCKKCQFTTYSVSVYFFELKLALSYHA